MIAVFACSCARRCDAAALLFCSCLTHFLQVAMGHDATFGMLCCHTLVRPTLLHCYSARALLPPLKIAANMNMKYEERRLKD